MHCKFHRPNQFLRHLFRKIRRGKFTNTGYYTLILTEVDKVQNLLETTTKILQLCWSTYIVNVIVVWPPIELNRISEVIAVYTYYPYDSEYCEQVRPVLLNYLHNGNFASRRHMFPNKLGNMFGCPVLVAMIDFYPYAMSKSTENGSVQYDGIDIRVSEELSNQLNFTRIIRYPANREDRGVVYANKTVSGALGMVRKIDK